MKKLIKNILLGMLVCSPILCWAEKETVVAPISVIDINIKKECDAEFRI